MSDTTTPPAGWYPDPERPGALRWWDGATWTSHRHVPTEPAEPTEPTEPAWRHAPPPAPPSRAPEPRSAAAPRRPTDLSLGWAAVVLATWLGSQIVSGVVLGVGLTLGGGDLEDPVVLAVLTLVTLAASLAAVVALLRWRLGGWAAAVGERRASLGWLVGGAVIGLAAPLVIGLGTDAGARLLDLPLPEEPSQAILAELVDAPPVVIALTFVFVVVLAPLLEELVFRRGLYASLAARIPTGPAVVASAVVFALVHVELLLAGAFGLLQLAGLTLLGVVFALLYQRTRSAWPSIAAHAAFNLVSLVAVLAVT